MKHVIVCIVSHSTLRRTSCSPNLGAALGWTEGLDEGRKLQKVESSKPKEKARRTKQMKKYETHYEKRNDEKNSKALLLNEIVARTCHVSDGLRPFGICVRRIFKFGLILGFSTRRSRNFLGHGF